MNFSTTFFLFLLEGGPRKVALRLTSLVTALLVLYGCVFGFPESYKYRITFLTLMLIIGILRYPLKFRRKEKLVFKLIDLFMLLIIIVVGVYSIWFSEELSLKHGMAGPFEAFLCIIFIVVTLEVTRRDMGWPLPLLVILFIIYNFYGFIFPEPFRHRGFDIFAFTDIQFLSPDGLFGIPLGVAATYIVVFIIFGAFYMKSGLANYLFDLAFAFVGTSTGGPAKVAVVSSGLFGSVSGSAAANVATTGSVTIPLMKRLGYPPHVAGAIEAVASAGGQFMPPIMGSAAFIIAMFLGIPYLKVAVSATIPAIMYYLSLGISVHCLAKKYCLIPLKKEECPPKREALRRIYCLLPVALVVIILAMGYTPVYAGFFGWLAVIILWALDRNLRKNFNLKNVVDAFQDGIIGALGVTLACASAGVVVGVVILTGIGFMLSAILIDLSGGNLFLILLLCMFTAIILGMGMTTVSVYILLSTLIVPALIKLGVPDIIAHFFPFYYGIISAITPPVAVASYTGAGIARTDPFKTSLEALKIGIPVFLIPWYFTFLPEVVLLSDPLGIIRDTLLMLIPLILLTSAVHGWLLRDLKLYERIALIILTILITVAVLRYSPILKLYVT